MEAAAVHGLIWPIFFYIISSYTPLQEDPPTIPFTLNAA